MSSLSIPFNLINKISQDVLRMTKSEPCGLNGCVINVELTERDDLVHHIGQICFDTSTSPSIELSLRLRKDRGAKSGSSSSSAENNDARITTRIQQFVNRVIHHHRTSDVIEIAPGFQLVKEKSQNCLVRTNSDDSNSTASGLVVDEEESSNDSSDSRFSEDSRTSCR